MNETVYVWDRELEKILVLNGSEVVGTAVGENLEKEEVYVKSQNGITYTFHSSEVFKINTGPGVFDGIRSPKNL